MLRWIGGCAVVLVVLVVIGMCAGYRQINRMAAEGPEETVVIYAPASRVFVSVASGDSLSEWRAEGLGIRASRPGVLRVGDSVIMQSTMGPGRNQRSTWHVRSVIPDMLIAFEMRSDTGGMIAVRKDSVIALGDSTQIISSLVATVRDSGRRATDSAGEGSAMADMASKMFLTAGRVNARVELLRLKARIEGDSTRPIP
jgi:uncharacterized protein YndB with AHSA1/START domain